MPPVCLRERTYRGPIPTIPDFTKKDPSEFTRLKIALENLLPPDATELFRYQILLDHLKFEEARLVANAYLNSPTPYSDTMAALTDKFGQPQSTKENSHSNGCSRHSTWGLASIPEICPTSSCLGWNAEDARA